MNELTLSKQKVWIDEGLSILSRIKKDRTRLLEILQEVKDAGLDPKSWAIEHWHIADSTAKQYISSLRAVTTLPGSSVTNSNLKQLAAQGSTRQTLEKFEAKQNIQYSSHIDENMARMKEQEQREQAVLPPIKMSRDRALSVFKELCGVDPFDPIKLARLYKFLSTENHPDRGGNHEIMSLLNQAKESLNV